MTACSHHEESFTDADAVLKQVVRKKRSRLPIVDARFALLSFAVGFIFVAGASPVLSETIRENGSRGTTGAQGSAGGAGQEIDRSAGPLDPINEVFLEGGLGGDGGNGGASVENGGDGGRGGNVRGTATTTQTTGSAQARVTATGGNGGSGGRPASGSSGIGGNGGAGGSAEGAGFITTPDELGGFVTLRIRGGQGGAGYGVGTSGGAGGTATATASATAGLDGNARAEIVAGGGRGGRGLNGGDGGDGADLVLDNTVSGSGDYVELVQGAGGGSGGDSEPPFGGVRGRGGIGGDATSNLSATNTEGSLSLESGATGGSGGDGGGAPGTARASAIGTARGDVSIGVVVRGGSGREVAGPDAIGPDGGAAILGPVLGTSTEGGNVNIRADVSGGWGGSGQTKAGNAASVVLENAIDAETEGAISLIQSARGGSVSSFGIPTSAGGGARGGDATSTLDTVKNASSLRIEANAQGGDSAGLDETGRSYSGGDATSQVDATNEAGDLRIGYEASGGEGARSGFFGPVEGVGGDATSIVRGRTTGDGNDISIARSGPNLGSTGGIGGGRGHTDLEAIAEGDSEVFVFSSAAGGEGARTSERGGDAEAHAFGRNAGASRVRVESIARGGLGAGDNAVMGMGGEAIATARGESTGGGDVDVEATAIGGGARAGIGSSARLINAVSGSTTGRLRLVQNATGGGAGERGVGDAESVLEWLDDDGGALEVESNATGGSGRASGSAIASAHAVGQDRVDVLATARGGEGTSDGTDGGEAALGRVYGESLGGEDVLVVGEATGGNGDNASRFGSGSSVGAGGDAILIDSVDGRTAGRLEMVQRATGGNAGLVSTGDTGRRGGAATSSLSGTFEAEFLDLRLEASGGTGSDSETGVESAGEGGRSQIAGTINNSLGGIRLNARSDGGDGGRNGGGQLGGDAGSATLDVTATSFAEGASVTLSNFTEGGSSPSRFGSNTAPRGAAADGSSRSEGEARGDARVDVLDSARGGSGANAGSATSYAIGRNRGSSTVDVESRAQTGRGVGAAGQLGSALANATGTSTEGSVTVLSNARVDTFEFSRLPLMLAPNSVAHAQSGGSGADLVVESRATHITGRAGELGFVVSANARGSLASELKSEARAGGRNPGSVFSSSAAASVAASGIHERDGEWTRIGMNLRPQLEDLDIQLATEVNLTTGILPERLEGVFVSFLEVRFDADFSELAFRIEYGEVVIVDEVFSDIASAAVFFGQVLDLGLLDPGEPDNPFPFPFPRPSRSGLLFTLEGTGATTESSFGVVFAVGTVVVPEPGTTVLLGFGLFVLAFRRRA